MKGGMSDERLEVELLLCQFLILDVGNAGWNLEGEVCAESLPEGR